MIRIVVGSLIGLLFGFMFGVAYGTWHLVEVDDSTLLAVVKAIKTIAGALSK